MHLPLQGFNSRHVNPWHVPPNPLCPLPQFPSVCSFDLLTLRCAGNIHEFFVVDLWVHGTRSRLQMLVSFLNNNIRIGMLNMLLVQKFKMTMLDTLRGDSLDTSCVGIATHRCCRQVAAMAMICSPTQQASLWATNHP